MPSKSQSSSSISDGQARYVLEKLLAERKISHSDVWRHLVTLATEIRSLEERLDLLRAASDTGSGSPNETTPTANATRRRRNLSPQRRAALKRQGHYVALMRQTPKTKRAHFTKIFKTKGGAAAIDALRKALGK